MSYLTPAILRDLSEVELEALITELEERGDQFDAKVQMLVNDELRRRGRAPLNSSKRFGWW